MLAVYGVLNARYASNTTLQWQIPIYVFTAQAALLAGLIASKGTTSIGLGWLAFVVGTIGPFVMRRIELTARWDRKLLSTYEDTLLGKHSQWRLLHDETLPARFRLMPLTWGGQFHQHLDLFVVKFFPPGVLVMGLMFMLGCAGTLVGYLK
jgi:hypothetical protein